MSNEFAFNFNTWTECVKFIDPWMAKAMKLEENVCKHIEDVKNNKSGVFGSLKALKNELKNYFVLEAEISNIRKFTRALQKYILLEIAIGENEVSALLDIVQETDKKMGVYFSLINAKSNEILSSRLTLTNIILSIAAVTIALITVFLPSL